MHIEDVRALQYKAGYRFLDHGVHAQVLDFPAAITCADDFESARRLLAVALLNVAESAVQTGLPLPRPDPLRTNLEMDIEKPVYLLLSAKTDQKRVPGVGVGP
jgi:predicted RNase H-like HicB family nuclease